MNIYVQLENKCQIFVFIFLFFFSLLRHPPLKGNRKALEEYVAYLEKKVKKDAKKKPKNSQPSIPIPDPEDLKDDESIDGGDLTKEEEQEKKAGGKKGKKSFDDFSIPDNICNELVTNGTTFNAKYKAINSTR